MRKTSLVKGHVDFSKVGEQISYDLAAKMVKNHHDKYGMESSFCYVTNKQIITAIFDQPGCVGLKVLDAVNEYGQNTVVFVGIDENGNNLTQITTVNDMGKLAVTPGMLGDHTRITTSWSD